MCLLKQVNYSEINVNVNVQIYSLKSLCVQQTLQFTPLVLELSLIRSHLLWENSAHFLQLMTFTIFPNEKCTLVRLLTQMVFKHRWFLGQVRLCAYI